MKKKRVLGQSLMRKLFFVGTVLLVAGISYFAHQTCVFMRNKESTLIVNVVGSSDEAPLNNPTGMIGYGPSIWGSSRVPTIDYELDGIVTSSSEAVGIPGVIYAPYMPDWIDLREDAPQLIVDRAVVFGPFQDELSLCISINNHPAKLFINEVEFCEDYSEDDGCCIDFSREKIYRYDAELLIGVAASKYENGDIYLAIKFYEAAKDGRGHAISVAHSEEMLKDSKSYFSKAVKKAEDSFLIVPVAPDAFIELTYEKQ